jgi:hypothetical protein
MLRLLPTASANLLRALLVGAAGIPVAAEECLHDLDAEAVFSVCGHGQIDFERAAYSDDARVVLYAEDALPIDHFAVYEVPIRFRPRTIMRSHLLYIGYEGLTRPSAERSRLPLMTP